MRRRRNLILGQGERLTAEVEVPSGGGPKAPPYNFKRARQRISKNVVAVAEELRKIPPRAYPNDEAVAIVTMHPRYISKSDYPAEFLVRAGLRPVGSRSREIEPENWGIKKHPETAVTEEIFVAGSLSNFERLPSALKTWQPNEPAARHLGHLEAITAFRARDKLRTVGRSEDTILFEVVLHNAGDPRILDAFGRYAGHLRAHPLLDRAQAVGGLTFVPVRAREAIAEDLAEFSFVRVARPMPTLRPIRPGPVRTRDVLTPGALPERSSLDPSVRAVVFDGGIPPGVDLSRWVSLVEPAGIGRPVPALQEHGLAVTSALLFGPVGSSFGPVFCNIDHVRVLDDHAGHDPELEYLDVLDRISGYLEKHRGRHQFVNFSLGPNLPMSDDDVTRWTATFDQYFAGGDCLATVAAGNGGTHDSATGLNRVQPPADGVNVLSVGACTNGSGSTWQRATYSSVGPGRNPGTMKPDGVGFGGNLPGEPFVVLSGTAPVSFSATEGTSFSAPAALRVATGIRAVVGHSLNPLAVRALLVHNAEPGALSPVEVGWGRLPSQVEEVLTCADDEVTVVYQGELPVGEHLRAPLPLPRDPIRGRVTIRATLLISPEVDAEHPSAYTRGGLEVSFRPHSGRYRTYKDGTRSQHPKTRSFFSPSNMFGAPEYRFREDGCKWEPCQKSSMRMNASSLSSPCFDIYYHHRESARKAAAPKPMPYALIVSLRAPRTKDLYDRVVRAYSQILVPIKTRLEVPVRT